MVGSWLGARDANASKLVSQHHRLTTEDNIAATFTPKHSPFL